MDQSSQTAVPVTTQGYGEGEGGGWRQEEAVSEGISVKALREKLEVAQSALSDYQQKARIVATDERLDHENAKLNELSSQLTLVQAQTSIPN